ncbi:MAG: hypothetical protein DRO88_04535 [Promethearchaeia archaeon]|nr:MAG: hypothetical protein DRO88_04535 [Candidatus Lokiarchaeia archaeon]
MGFLNYSVYEPIEKEIPVVIILYCLIIIQVLLLTLFLIFRWRNRRVLAIRYLSWSFCSYVLAFSCFLVSALEGLVTGYKMQIYRYFMGFGYFFFILGHILFILFSKEIFSLEWKNVQIYIIIGGIVSISVVLPQNYYGVPTGSEGPDNIRFYSSLAMLIFSLFLFGRIALRTFQVYRKMTLKYARYGFLGFFIGEIAMIFVFLFILADFLYWEFNLLSGYTIFYYFAVISGIVSIGGFFLGIYVPPKLQAQEFRKLAEKMLVEEKKDEMISVQNRVESVDKKNLPLFNSRSIGLSPLPKTTGEKPAILIQCPSCLNHLYYEIPKSLIQARAQNQKDLVSIKIPVGLICNHSFLVYLDRNFSIRSYSMIDLENKG